MSTERIEEIDHLRLRALFAEEALAHRAAADTTTAREQAVRGVLAKYLCTGKDSIDATTGAITRAPAPLALVPGEPAS